MQIPSFRLYRRIFLLLLIAQVLIAVGAVTATVLVARAVSSNPVDWGALAREAGTAYKAGGLTAFTEWQKRQYQEKRVTFLIDAKGQSVDNHPIPRPFEHWARMSPSDQIAIRDGPPGRGGEVISPVPSDVLKGYRLLVLDQKAPFFKLPMLYRLGSAALIAIILIAIITFFLTRSLARPIIELRQVTQSVAAGDYSKRLGVKVLSRDDEIGELAADFDAMAERIQDQFQNQHQLFRDVSHELKSPLARLQLAIELLRAETSSGDVKWLERLDKEAHALASMIDRILMLAQVDPSAVDIRKGHVDIEVLLTSLIDDAQFEARKKGQTITFEASPESVSVRGSQMLLASAIENVIRNAVIYGQEDTTIKIAASVLDGRVTLTIENRGESLRASDLRRIFEPFYRTPGDRIPPSTGQGIGLAITRNVVQAHGGSVVALNHPDGGLIMQIVLPTDA